MERFWGLSGTAWTGIYTIITFGLLVVAVVAALYAKKQWQIGREQAEDARRAQVEASRPYVVVAVEPSGASGHLFDLTVRNIGRRPALSVSITLDGLSYKSLELAEFCDIADKVGGPIPFSPNGIRDLRISLWHSGFRSSARDTDEVGLSTESRCDTTKPLRTEPRACSAVSDSETLDIEIRDIEILGSRHPRPTHRQGRVGLARAG